MIKIYNIKNSDVVLLVGNGKAYVTTFRKLILKLSGKDVKLGDGERKKNIISYYETDGDTSDISYLFNLNKSEVTYQISYQGEYEKEISTPLMYLCEIAKI